MGCSFCRVLIVPSPPPGYNPPELSSTQGGRHFQSQGSLPTASSPLSVGRGKGLAERGRGVRAVPGPITRHSASSPPVGPWRYGGFWENDHAHTRKGSPVQLWCLRLLLWSGWQRIPQGCNGSVRPPQPSRLCPLVAPAGAGAEAPRQSCWFLAGGLFSFFATWTSPERRWREEPAACFIKASKEQSQRGRQKLQCCIK